MTSVRTHPDKSIGMYAPPAGSATITASHIDFYTDSSCQRFHVTYRDTVLVTVKPTVSGISPARGLIGVGTSVTISGTGFGSSPTVSAGTGITATVSSSNGTSISATFNVASNAPIGDHPVTVTAGGQTSSSVDFYVQKPTSLKVLGVTVLPDGPDPPDGCPGSANYGIKVDIHYQIQDQNSPPNAIQSESMTPHETGTHFDGTALDSDIGPVPGYPTSGKTTAADGTFHDVPFGVCSTLPIDSPGLSASQTITTILPGGTFYTVRSQSFTVNAPGSGSFGHGTVTNGSDISASR